MQEQWKPVVGYNGLYEVSNLGRVRGLDRYVKRSDGRMKFVDGRIITGVPNTDGYLQIKLCRDGSYKTVRVHQLVAMAFLGEPPAGYEVNHKDNNRQNNALDNLEYCSHGDNVRQSIKSGNHFCTRDITGSNNPNFDNHILRDRYRADPELARKVLARPGGQNGRARKVYLYNLDEEFVCEFGCMKECAEYLIQNELVEAKSLQYVTDHIARALNTGNIYNYYYFKTA